jgi:quercetin dioxygenase-like cupin family protein
MTDQTSDARFTMVEDPLSMVEITAGRLHPVTVLKATGANVVVFGFSEGAELREHTALQPVLLQALSGRLRVSLAGEERTLQSGDLLHIEARVPHSVLALEDSHLQLTVLMIDSPGPSHIPHVG